ncbi:MAG TPA: hypothetical protein VGX28_02220 [Frankiaceae bacterium]|jgi:hypothetical protein|nr:hypothetical protein [Frankiaceae bacterium]
MKREREALLSAALMLGSVLLAPARAETTYAEQQGRHGVNTFKNYHNASDMGPRIEPAQWVQVSCKVHDPYIQSVNPDGYWYRIASSPWNNQYYSPANTFMNGDPGAVPTLTTPTSRYLIAVLRRLPPLRRRSHRRLRRPRLPRGELSRWREVPLRSPGTDTRLRSSTSQPTAISP